MANVLQKFAIQSKLTLAYEPQSLTEQQSAGLNGSYTIEQGLQNILTPHSLQAVRLNNGGFSIQKIKNNQTHSNTTEIVQLNPITVTATPSSRVQQNNADIQQLPVITITAEQNGSAEDGYLTKNITGVGLWDKRSLQDTPYQMSVISQEMIENTASGIEQVFKMNPLVQFNYSSTSANSYGAIGVHLRGLSATDNIAFDGIPLPAAYTSSTQDLERVEILNGLSGFLYGVGYVGGVVNYISKKPTQERLTNVTIGSTGNQAFYGHIDLGGKVDKEEKFAYRLNAFKQDGETSIKDQKVDKSLISGALDWHVTDDLTLSFDASHKENKIDKLPTSINYSNDPASKFDPKQGYAPDWTFINTLQDRLGFKSIWHINDHIKLRTGYIYLESERDQSIGFVYDNNDDTYQFKYYRIYPSIDKKQGAYIYTDFDFNTFGIQHNLTLGGSGYKNKSYSNTTANDWIDLGSYGLDQLNHVAKPTYLGSSSDPTYLSGESDQINFMIGDDIRFNEHWSALLGINYAKVTSDSYNKSGSRTGGYDSDKITPSFSLIYKPFENLTTYATYMESLQSGTIVGDIYKNAGEVFAPYVSKQYELGAKSTISDNILLSSALFRIEKANSYEDLTTEPKTLTQDGVVLYEGLELTLTGKVNDHLTIVGGGTLLNLKIDKANSYEGKKPTGVASKMAKLYAEYTIPAIEGLTVTGGAYYTGKAYTNGENTETIPAYTIFDAGLRYSTHIASYPTTFILNATNVTNKKYWVGQYRFGEPQNIAFAVKTEF
ncbi:TonB-dependent siderophore receptor [Acinetobacter puyangensis]|uniref:TonB-dependent siderophore receptor n=1 Tax=Acinetobacter puyangensis TaxID=1096779 RepID=UPI003A4D2A9D